MEVGQIGADNDHRLRAAPELAESRGHICRSSLADHQRHGGKPLQEHLEKWQLNLERVLGSMRPVCELNRRQHGDRRKGVAVQRNGAKRCFKGFHGRNREPMKRDVVHGPRPPDDAVISNELPSLHRAGQQFIWLPE